MAVGGVCRTTLTDPDLLALLETERILVWGGDVRAKDAYQSKLG